MIEATNEPCTYCDADADEECRTMTGLGMDRIHISRGGEVGQKEAELPLLADALNRHPTDIARFMRENGL